jgi:methionyl-tRNA formyltransferase
MDVGVDTGDIVAKKEVPVAADETGGSLFDKLAVVGAKLCVEAMEQIEAGEAVYVPQDHSQATHTSMIHKDLGLIDWNKPAAQIECLVRGLNPWPSAYTHLEQKTLKIWKSEVIHQQTDQAPGCVVKVLKDAVWVQTGDEILAISEVQLEGKKRMPCDAFLRGYQMKEGTIL